MKKTFHVSGTHCASCKILIEDILSEQDFIKESKVNLNKETIELETDVEDNQFVVDVLNDKIGKHGYSVSATRNIDIKEGDSDVIWQAIPVGLMFLVLFFILQKSGILNFGLGGEITPLSGFVIGVVASLSSCLAVVGGLVLSLSAKVAEDGGDKKPFVLFHIGRLVGFALLGGVLGLIGEKIGVSFVLSTVLGIFASVIMILLGLNLIGALKKNKFTLPSNIFSYFRKVEHSFFAPILVGVGTFFLPCGFTQSMQIVALSSGSFISGLSIMFFFALGTLPVLALLSFGAVSFSKSKYAPLFFKSSGVIVLGLGIFALLGVLASLGIINPLFNI